MTDYQAFLKSKQQTAHQAGFDVDVDAINPKLAMFQRDTARWLIRKGRGAAFADTGLGKTWIQVEVARLIDAPYLLIAPLAVARQTVEQARTHFDLDLPYIRSQSQVTGDHKVYITNYEMVEHFDPDYWDGVGLDESSILKSIDGKTRKLLTSMFQDTPYRHCYSATPAPNDITEIGRHAEFIGVMSNAEMLSAFFINDQKMKDGTYRLKGHAVNKFYAWLASWAIAIKKPSDMGYSNDGYNLPPKHVHVHTVESDYVPDGMLPGFYDTNLSAIDVRRVRKATIDTRIAKVAEMVNADNEAWTVWCGLNEEAIKLNEAIPGSVNVHGSMSPEEKAQHLMDFVRGDTRVLITKTKIAGFGINMQHCANTAFCGIDYSWEQYYQAVRRFWRFGQQREVNVHVVISEQERSVFESVLNKEKEAIKMTSELVRRSSEYMRNEMAGIHADDWTYETSDQSGQDWQMMLGDSVERIGELSDNSVDLSVFSPPFVSLYTYTPTERDLGNSRNEAEFFAHFDPIIHGLLRITKSGRNCCVHVQQVAATKVNDGYIGIKDFRGDVIRAFIKTGWVFYGEVTIDKDPQVQAIRTKAKGLMFAQLNKDSADSRPAYADYMLIFKKPGDNAVSVTPDVDNDEWIRLARPVWYGIRESDVLNVAVARADRDERHMCPLQLPVIENCVRLYSNPGEIVFSPFAGIGSEGVGAIRHGRKFIGIELKPEYWKVACDNLTNAERTRSQMSMFDDMDSLKA